MIAADDWQTEARKVIQAIDQAEGPVYLVDMAEIGTPADNAAGCWSAIFDLQLRPMLRDAALWTGRGFCCLVDAKGIEEQFRQSRLPEVDARRKILAIAIHEYAHYLVARPLLPEARADEIIASSPEPAKLLAMPITIGPDDPRSEPWKDHDGIRFGRLAVHLWHRAVAAGFDFHPNDVWPAHDFYRLSGPVEYVDALADEPRRRSHEPLREIINSPMPERYAEFCERDLERARAKIAQRIKPSF